MTLTRSLEGSAPGPFPGADLPMAGRPRAAERKGRHGSGEAAAGADGPLRGASTGAPSPQEDRETLPAKRPDPSGDLLVRFLATDPAFPGIGVARASQLREAFGDELARVLGSGDASLLESVLGRDLAETLASRWQEHLARADVVVWLADLGFEAYLATKAVRFWGADAPKVLRENPYALLAVAGWDKVDAAARCLGFGPGHPARQVAAAEAAAYRRLDRAHTWTEAGRLEASAARILGSGLAAGRAAVRMAMEDRALVEVGGGFQPLGAHVMERFVADRLAAMLAPPASPDLLVGPKAVAKALADGVGRAAPGSFALSAQQEAAVSMALSSQLGLLLGGAGTGKTTALAAVHRAAGRCGVRVIQMALSGRAAARMREATGQQARTIAGFLRACDKGELKPGPDCLAIVDEASMLDVPLLYSIMRRLGRARLLLVGDPCQLPPIQFGLTFHLLAALPGIPKVELTEVHRHAAETGIPGFARDVRDGSVPHLLPFEPGSRRGVSFVDCGPGDAVHAVTDVLSSIGGAGGETRVLASVLKGPAGVEAVNAHLHRVMSPGQRMQTERLLARGDPVMFRRNDYARDLQNGSLGRILGFPAPGVGEVDFDGRKVALAGGDLDNLVLAYCLTVHKAQGSQFRRIVMPVFPAGNLDRTMLYTAVTRATEQVVLVGDRDAFRAAVKAEPASGQRETGLERMLKSGDRL